MICGPPDGTHNKLQYIEQGETSWGDWTEEYFCPKDYYIVSFNQQVKKVLKSMTNYLQLIRYQFNIYMMFMIF
jgi:hypothetical protein